MDEMPIVEQFFYTTNSPHEWGNGPRMWFTNQAGRPITSLDEAKELAELYAEGTPGHSGWVKTGYGIEYRR